MPLYRTHTTARPEPDPLHLAYGVRTMGRIRGLNYHSTYGTYYDHAMITVVLGGKGRYLWQGQAQSIEAGMIGLVLGPQRDPGILMADPSDPYDHIYCRFTGFEARPLAERIAAKHHPQRFFKSTLWQDVAEVFVRALVHGPIRENQRPNKPMRYDAALLEALTLLDAPSAVPGRRLTAERLHGYLEHHMGEPANLQAVADHFAVSKPHLCRMARRLLGMPLQQYWIQMKMDWACTLLREPTLSIAQVANHVGYTDPLYFSKVFKQRTGHNPSEWRKQVMSLNHG